jgi:hypothetical protein
MRPRSGAGALEVLPLLVVDGPTGPRSVVGERQQKASSTTVTRSHGFTPAGTSRFAARGACPNTIHARHTTHIAATFGASTTNLPGHRRRSPHPHPTHAPEYFTLRASRGIVGRLQAGPRSSGPGTASTFQSGAGPARPVTALKTVTELSGSLAESGPASGRGLLSRPEGASRRGWSGPGASRWPASSRGQRCQRGGSPARFGD